MSSSSYMNYQGNRPNYLSQLVAKSQLTVDGRDWLTLSLDPFHDMNHHAAGYPDADGSQTVVSCYQYQMDLSAPAAGANWDAHIFSMPVAQTNTCFGVTESVDWASLTDPAAAAACAIGPLTVLSGPAGANIMPNVPLLAGTTSAGLPATPLGFLIDGASRLIGMGFEVTNTTAEMYKQGSVTAYRMPQFTSDTGSVAMLNAAGTHSSTMACKHIRKPPSSVAECNTLKGTRTWDAAAGVYATISQNSTENPIKVASTCLTILSNVDHPDGAATDMAIRSPTVLVTNNVGPSLSNVVPKVTQLTPFDTTGAYFTGLSEQTTLCIKVRYYVERAPTHTESALAVLATPSAGLDTKALEIYSLAISQLPVAVPVSENALGDWFRTVLNVVKTVSGGASGLLGAVVPGAQQIGTGVNMVAGALESLLRPKKKEKRNATPKRVTVVPQPKQLMQKKKKKADAKSTVSGGWN